ASLLAVRESWLRRRAGQRTIPCTFIGKHLRFSQADLRAIVDSGRQTPPAPRSRPRRTRRR
ncbi:DNA-binding protein, partial [Saccharothrix sp. MB29]|nr:DNA-binding protein [Saccharothrix sp. MB29]